MQRFAAFGAIAALSWAALGPVAPAVAAGGSMRFSSETTLVHEGSGLATIRVERSGPLAVGSSSVDFATSRSGTATVGADYRETAGTLTFEMGESVKTFTVAIQDDSIAEDTEEIVLTLSNPRGEADSAGPPAYLLIVDDDARTTDHDAQDTTPPAAPTPPAGLAPPGPAPAAAPPTTVRTRGPAARSRVAARARQPTPFILRTPSGSPAPATREPLAVEPLLAVVAALLVARVTAEIWFRTRGAGPRE